MFYIVVVVCRVRCVACSSSVRFSPSTDTFPVTYVTVTGLAPLTSYRFEVYSENGVSKVRAYIPVRGNNFKENIDSRAVFWLLIRPGSDRKRTLVTA